MAAPPLTWQALLFAYSSGYFPMSENRDATELFWFCPEQRGILPMDDFHIPASLEKLLRREPFRITLDTAFRDVMLGCAQRDETWINDDILRLYGELFDNGFAHSVECWQGDQLVGGIYGVALGRAFFGESMFSRASSASKVALVSLMHRLKNAGFTLFDTQYINPHLLQFGAKEIPREEYLALLKQALAE